MPFFSIIVPSFNRAHILPRVISLVLSQTFPDFELIIVDDGSSDNTSDVIKAFLSEDKIKYLYQNNKGVCSARNFGSTNATGQFLIFLDSDDEIEKTWLQDFHEVIVSTKALLVFCNVKIVEPGGETKLIHADKPYANSSSKGFFVSGCWALSASKFFEAGMYDEQIKFGENTELRIRLGAMGLPVAVVNKFNFIYNVSVSGGSQNNHNKLHSILYTINKHHAYFEKSPGLKKVQMQTAAVAAARMGMRRKANQILGELLKEHKSDFKLWVRYCISLNGFLTKWIWK